MRLQQVESRNNTLCPISSISLSHTQHAQNRYPAASPTWHINNPHPPPLHPIQPLQSPHELFLPTLGIPLLKHLNMLDCRRNKDGIMCDCKTQSRPPPHISFRCYRFVDASPYAGNGGKVLRNVGVGVLLSQYLYECGKDLGDGTTVRGM